MSALREPPRRVEEDLDLADIVVQLRGLRTASQKRRYRGAPPPLPSREIIVDLVDALVSALYPRHFGPADLAAKDVDAFVTRTLDSALHALHRQVELELALAKEWRGDNRIDTPLRAGDLQYLWKAARAGIARLNRLLAETGNSDEDMIFHVRDAGDEWRSKDLGRSAVDPRKP